ncbi:MAG: DNA polymerase III subunit delta [Spirochaetales bacterium]|nr:DNA polymerase III subunit delta [Spirochaetales bacterium]
MKGKTSRIWLLLGPETGQKQTFIQELKKDLAKEFGQEPEVHRHYAFEVNFSDVLSLALNGDLFCPHKLILVGNAEELKKADAEKLKEFLEQPNPPSTLVLLSEETRQEALGKVIPKDQVKVFWEMFEGQKKGWVIHHFQELNLTLTPDAADFFLEMVDNNTEQIRLEAQKLRAFFERGWTITLNELEAFLVHSKEENVFTLFERIADGNFAKALEILKKILSAKDTEGIGLLSGLVWQFKTLLNFQVKILERQGVDEAFLALNIRAKKAQGSYLAASRKYSLHDVQNILVLISEFDLRLRLYKAEHHALLLELFLYYLMLKKGRLPEIPEF